MRNITPLSPIEDGSRGGNLKAAMKRSGMTVAALSKATGISERTITALRSGRSGGNFATWRALARALGASVEELVSC